MTYHQHGDRVHTPDGPGTCLGLWPERTLVMVRLKSGRTRSYDRHQVTPLQETSEVMRKTMAALADFFGDGR